MNRKPIRVVVISDTHTFENRISLPPGDILIHCGDFCMRGELEEIGWFSTFLKTTPYQHKIVIAGNHEIAFEDFPLPARKMLTGCTYLQDEMVEVKGLKIYGSPWQPNFNDWAFNLSRGEALRKKWDKIPEGLDILVTHSPPHLIGDRVDIRNEGCEELRKAVERVRPKYHVFGHIHEGYGSYRGEHTTFINASTCDARYVPINPPVVLEL